MNTKVYMALAEQQARRSTSPNRTVGCVVVKNDVVVARGFNQPSIAGCHFLHGEISETLGPFGIVHAEIVALLTATDSVDGGVLYTTAFPCCTCAAAICFSKIAAVVSPGIDTQARSKWAESWMQSIQLFDRASIEVVFV